MVNKTTATKFEMEKFNGKEIFSFWQRRVRAVLAKKRLLKALHNKASKVHDMTDTDWKDMDIKVAGTIDPCLEDGVMYNVQCDGWDFSDEIMIEYRKST